MPKFPFYHQLDAMDCGPSCLRMVAKHYGKSYSNDTLRQRCYITREGVSLLGLSKAAESIGFRTMGVKVPFHELESLVPLPCVAYWQQKRWEWERIQIRLFKINIKGLTLGQVQQLGSVFFNQSTSIIITFIAAKAVVEGILPLGCSWRSPISSGSYLAL